MIGLPGVTTPTVSRAPQSSTPDRDLTAWTNSFQNIQCYDTLKVNAILNEIDGWDHLRTKKTQVPTIFGMNFQAVSVAQKLIEPSNSTTADIWMPAGTPSDRAAGRIPVRGCLDRSVCQRTEETGALTIRP